MKKLADLFEHEIKDLYSAEKQLTEALPKMHDAANDPTLKKAFKDHLAETETQLQRIHEICQILEINPTSTKCDAMAGLVEEGESMIKEKADPDVKDAGLIACAQRVEHYEISGYGTSVRYAKELGHTKIAEMLQTTLDEEYNADSLLTKIAEQRINPKAIK